MNSAKNRSWDSKNRKINGTAIKNEAKTALHNRRCWWIDFDIEDRICLKSLYYLDEKTHQKISELIERARTATNKHRDRRLLDWTDSLSYKGNMAQIEIVGESKLEPNEFKKDSDTKHQKFNNVARIYLSNLQAWVNIHLFGSRHSPISYKCQVHSTWCRGFCIL